MHELIWIFKCATTCLNPKNLTMDHNFCRTLLTDAHSKDILIISAIYSQNFRKLQDWFSEFEWDENKTQIRKSNWLLIKKVEFQQHEHFEVSEFRIMSWRYYKWNNAALSLQYNKNTWTTSPIIQRFIKG